MFNKDVKVPLQEAELVGTSSSNKKCNQNAKYSCLLAITVFPTIFVKQFRVCLVLIQKPPEIDAKVLELVLKCNKSKLNHAI